MSSFLSVQVSEQMHGAGKNDNALLASE